MPIILKDDSLNLSVFSYRIGRFLAELTKQVFSDLAASKYQVLPCFPVHLCHYFFCVLSAALVFMSLDKELNAK